MDDISKKRNAVYKKFASGYISLLCLPIMFFVVSLMKGAGWKPIIGGLPVYVTVFVGITYQLIKELRSISREERGEPPPPPKRGPWEEE
ncbi:hypothetical protein C7417_5719 [Cupriavidus plantarum]|nr:hypothetical protein C7417_5719 [Cupriavidus plantarum]